MCPNVIADSDDESDSVERYSSLPSPRPQTAPAAAAQASTRSLDQESLATASTDSVFFQNVYNDQNDAAKRQSLPSQSNAAKEDVHQSSAVTIPDHPYHRTTKGFYNSSMTSITEPNTDRYQRGPSDENMEPTQAFSSDRDRVQDVVQQATEDPWEIPSSPENPRVSRRALKRQAASREAPKMRNDDGALNHSAIPDALKKGSGSDQSRDAKRRRLREPSQCPPRASDEVDLIQIHSSSEIGHCDEKYDDTTLTSYTPVQPFTPMRNNNLLLQQQTLYTAGTSSTNTNINTPHSRTLKPSNFGVSTPQLLDGKIAAGTSEYGSLRPEPDPSSDDMPPTAPVPAASGTLELEHETHDDGPAADLGESAPVVAPMDECSAEVKEVIIEEAIVKPRKRRGRPKKNEDGDELQPTKHGNGRLALEIEAAPAPEPAKKKRGRPKKKSSSDAADQVPLYAAAPAPLTGMSDTNPDVDVAEMANVGSTSAKNEDAVDVLSRDNPAESPMLLPLEDNKDEVVSVSTKKGDTGLHSGTLDVPASREESSTDAKPLNQGVAPKRETKSVNGKGTAAKPAFRVGLSKRLKIAPLLKSVPK